ncbi:NAD(P)-dependent dehydrogenase (short-subunit alcohol dehydrogenase family) [Umezawaea tangerina]|uniref:NAD(P)-dependent dehydrogenase (Short-subunit alcohol dehydrogenase family) n=1 Tax=Umezawaea tangerina TaxID=84725 RepID=A0A2T0SV69_9PSEU|nr:NAD(P)-dependent dehydrogenase (short-subunit alcohol dehydrogenase family) [Umezawaea tangerina]
MTGVVAGVVDSVLDRAIAPGYSVLGFTARKHFWPADPPAGALRGRVAVVTGANSGLGKAAATGLAELGAIVRLVVRDTAKGEKARAEILARVPGAEVRVDRCDVSDLADVRKFAEGLTGPVDVLVHNAGVLPPSRTETADGHEVALATAVLGPFLLTDLLAPALRASADGRVLFVSSGGMYSQPLRMDDPEYREGEFAGAKAYSRVKRMQVVLAELWAEELRTDAVVVHSMHPGWADTPGVSTSLPRFHQLAKPFLRTPEQGADTVVWLAASAEAGRETGRFWHDRRVRPTHYLPWGKESEVDRQALWAYCRSATAACRR